MINQPGPSHYWKCQCGEEFSYRLDLVEHQEETGCKESTKVKNSK